MSEITETEYTTWKYSTFGNAYMIWHDGLPVEVVTPLTGDARSHAIRMLIFGLQMKDGHAAEALAAMGETSALPHLRTALATASDDAKVPIALAINELSPKDNSSALAKELVSVLDSQVHWGVKIHAAIGLRDFKDEESEEALLKAVERQEDYLVKYHSCESLLIRWGVQPPSISAHNTIFQLICSVRDEHVIGDEAERGKEAVKLLKQLKK